jgi:solute carrier family 25 citrate transporter 1
VATDFAPTVVLTADRDPALDKLKYKHDGSRGAMPQAEDFRKRLVAPMAGFFSAGLEISLVWPSEYGKVQLQLNRHNPKFRVLPYMMKQGFGIYKGLAPMLIGAPIQGMLRFGSLDFFNNLLRDPDTGKVGRASGLLAGISAGVLEAIIVVTPMETIKTQLVESKKGLLDGVKYVVANQGVGGLYKGLLPTMAKSASNQALRFFIFNEYKRIVIGSRPVHELSPLESLIGGMTAGCLGAVCNTPFDTVKTRMQGLEAARYKGLVDCARQMVTTEGVLSLWKGLGARLMRVVPGQGIIFCSYESIFSFLSSQLV